MGYNLVNAGIQASSIESALPIQQFKVEESCPVGKPTRVKREKPKASFAELAAEYRGTCVMAGDPNIDWDLMEKFNLRSWEIRARMIDPSLPMNRTDEVTLVEFIKKGIADAGLSFSHVFEESQVNDLLLKLLNNIAASN
jgi:hypothetical protein